MFSFKWDDFADDALLDRVRLASGLSAATELSHLRPRLRRIQGFGEQGAKELANVIRFDRVEDLASEKLMLSEDFASNLQSLMSVQPGTTEIAKLEGALLSVAVTCASEPHPYAEAGMQHPMGLAAAPAGGQTGRCRSFLGIGILPGASSLFSGGHFFHRCLYVSHRDAW
ncbi:MAG: hypothetical protein V3W41_11940 [Planctomycetota bacterium]